MDKDKIVLVTSQPLSTTDEQIVALLRERGHEVQVVTLPEGTADDDLRGVAGEGVTITTPKELTRSINLLVIDGTSNGRMDLDLKEAVDGVGLVFKAREDRTSHRDFVKQIKREKERKMRRGRYSAKGNGRW